MRKILIVALLIAFLVGYVFVSESGCDVIYTGGGNSWGEVKFNHTHTKGTIRKIHGYVVTCVEWKEK